MSVDSIRWDQRYVAGDTPWDTGLVSRELRKLLESQRVTACVAADLGCGTGTNAIELARRGFQVMGLDCSEQALQQARRKASSSGLPIEFRQVDLAFLDTTLPVFEFLFDRGCYHCVRRVNLEGFLETVSRITKAGTVYQLLTGNARESMEKGPPTVTEAEIRDELGSLFEVESIEEFRFEDPGGVPGPLGWSCVLVRR